MMPVKIGFGCLADSITDQLKEQGYEAPKNEGKRFDRLSRSINHLLLNGLISDSTAAEARKRLMREICASARPIAEVQE